MSVLKGKNDSRALARDSVQEKPSFGTGGRKRGGDFYEQTFAVFGFAGNGFSLRPPQTTAIGPVSDQRSSHIDQPIKIGLPGSAAISQNVWSQYRQQQQLTLLNGGLANIHRLKHYKLHCEPCLAALIYHSYLHLMMSSVVLYKSL